MRELDILYPVHREEFLNRIRKQTQFAEYDTEDTAWRGRRRKPTKPSKNVETKPNTKLYAPKGSWR